MCDLKNVRVAAESENALLVALEGNILFVRDKGADSFKKVLPDVEKVYARFGLNVAVQRDGLVWVWGDYADRRTSRSKKFRQEKPRLVMENGKSVAVDGNGNIYAATKKGTLWRLCPKDGY